MTKTTMPLNEIIYEYNLCLSKAIMIERGIQQSKKLILPSNKRCYRCGDMQPAGQECVTGKRAVAINSKQIFRTVYICPHCFAKLAERVRLTDYQVREGFY